MMDDRFPIQPDIIKIPLYKSSTGKKDIPIVQLLDSISNKYSLEKSKILLAESATNALLCFLQEKFSCKKRVAMPAFFCSKVAYEFYKSGYEILFFDFFTCKDLDKSTLDFFIRNVVEIVILPSFFCKQKWELKTIHQILDKNIVIVMDYAHTFPYEQPLPIKRDNLVTLFSFGKNKPFASSKGGGIYYHGSEIPPIPIQKEPNKVFSTNKDFYLNMSNLLNNKLLPITNFIVNQHIELKDEDAQEILQNEQIFYSYGKTLCLEITKRIQGSYILQKLIPPNYIPTNVLFIKSHNRYKLSAKLSKKGIQTTWYYFPLPLLELFKKSTSMNLNKTIDIASKILILPFSIHHSLDEMNYILDSLETTKHD